MKICCFAGHSRISDHDKMYGDLLSAIEDLYVNEDVREFLVGNYGDFDYLAAKAVRSLKNTYPDIKLNLVIPYLTKSINDSREKYYQYFDSIIMADIPEKTPTRFRISKCNEYMVRNSNFLICFVTNNCGGAAKTLEYSKRKKLVIINLAEEK